MDRNSGTVGEDCHTKTSEGASPRIEDLVDTIQELYPGAWAACLTPLCEPDPPHSHSKKLNGEWVEEPCKNLGKKPLGAGWNTKAMARLAAQSPRSSESEQQLDQHLRDMAKHLADGGNIGFAVPPGVLVVDIDDQYSMMAAENIDEFQDAPRQLTRKGAHYCFQAPIEAADWPQDSKILLDIGLTIDLRLAERGQVAVAPSIHETGFEYAWDRELPATRSELPVMSDGLVKMVSEGLKRKKVEKAAVKGSAGGKVGQGERQSFLVRECGHLVNAGLRGAALYGALSAINQERCDPPWPDDELQTLVDNASEKWADNGTTSTGADDEGESRAAKVRRVLNEVIDRASYFRTGEGIAYASIPVDGHLETWCVESLGFADWVERSYWDEAKSIPPEKPFEAAIRQARQKARFEGNVRPVSLRCAMTGDIRDGSAKVFLDLCDEKWRQIEISRDGWRIVDDSPVHLRRTPGMLPLPMPVKTGDVSQLREVLNVSTDEDFIMLVGWILSVVLPGMPQPILVVNGPQGSGKSTASELAGQTADPNTQHISGFPRSIEDFHISADNTRVVAIDNVSSLRPEISDELARAATGAAFRKRSHYKNREQQTFTTKAPIILNGIPDFVSRPDLAERSIFIELSRIAKDERRSEGEVKASFDLMHPTVLGGLLDASVMGLRNMPTVDTSNLERMADWHAWMRACEPALPWPTGGFDAAYQENRKGARERLMESSEAFGALVDFMHVRDEWSGTGKELLAQLRTHAGLAPGDDEKAWPRSGKGMVALLGRVVAELAEEEIQFIRPMRKAGGNRDRVLTLRKTENSRESIVPNVPPCGDSTRDDGTIGTMKSEQREENSPDGVGWGYADDGRF